MPPAPVDLASNRSAAYLDGPAHPAGAGRSHAGGREHVRVSKRARRTSANSLQAGESAANDRSSSRPASEIDPCTGDRRAMRDSTGYELAKHGVETPPL